MFGQTNSKTGLHCGYLFYLPILLINKFATVKAFVIQNVAA